MKFKNNIKKYIVVFVCFAIISFCMSFTCTNNIVYADTSSGGGGGGSFGNTSSGGGAGGSFGNTSSGGGAGGSFGNTSSGGGAGGSFDDAENKTGQSINDVTSLGENVLSETSGVVADLPNKGGSGTEAGSDAQGRYAKFNNALYKIWGVILVVLQIASVAGVIFAGVRYMFASADAKADLKKSMIHLVIGMIIVFGASTVVGFITGTFKDIFKPLL